MFEYDADTEDATSVDDSRFMPVQNKKHILASHLYRTHVVDVDVQTSHPSHPEDKSGECTFVQI